MEKEELDNIDELLDEDGYPTAAWLKLLRTYSPSVMPLKTLVMGYLPDGWHFGDWGYSLKRPYGGVRILKLHTGGWSGNEQVINAILQNPYLTTFLMRYVKWETGGHYTFEIPTKNLE